MGEGARVTERSEAGVDPEVANLGVVNKLGFRAKVEHVDVHFLQQSQFHITLQQQGIWQLQHNLLAWIHREHVGVEMWRQSLMHLECIELLKH